MYACDSLLVTYGPQADAACAKCTEGQLSAAHIRRHAAGAHQCGLFIVTLFQAAYRLVPHRYVSVQEQLLPH